MIITKRKVAIHGTHVMNAIYRPAQTVSVKSSHLQIWMDVVLKRLAKNAIEGCALNAFGMWGRKNNIEIFLGVIMGKVETS